MQISDNLFWRRLHSFTGTFPLGMFLLFHLYTNSYSLGGPLVYDGHIRPLRELPYLLAIEIAFIYVPLLYHSFYGVYIWSTGKANVFQYPWPRNWLFTMQRVTGVAAFVFVWFHVFDQRLKPAPSFANVEASVHQPLVMLIYIFGVAATAWHFFSGVWNFFVKWGITIGRRAQAVSLAVFSVMGAGLIFMGLRALMGFIE